MLIKFNDYNRKQWEFDNIKALKEFCINEKEFWEEKSKKIKEKYPRQSISTFFNIFSTFSEIINKLESIEKLDDVAQQNRQLADLQNQKFNNLYQNFIWSKQPLVHNWINSYDISLDTGNAFIESLLKNNTNTINNFNALKGHILAYEFALQEESYITQRRSSESKSIEELRIELEDRKNSLVTEVDKFQNQFNTWHDDTISKEERSSLAKKKTFKHSQRNRSSDFNKFMKDSKERIEELENTYHEKLRLEKPAEYWKKKASSYELHGYIWSIFLFLSLITGILFLNDYFNTWLKAEEVGLKLNSLQGAVIFITIITLYAILLKTMAKMVFSSFHLQRDAEEREQLTHVYLALTNEDGKIDDDSRKIVLQALFSRADSGLLHKDSSPTMPGIAELMKASRGGQS